MMPTVGSTRQQGGASAFEQAARDALPIIFLHGVGSTKSVWAPQLAVSDRTARPSRSTIRAMVESDFVEGATATITHRRSSRADGRADDRAGPSLRPVAWGVVALAMHAAAPHRCASLMHRRQFRGATPTARASTTVGAASKSMTMRALAEARSGV